MLSQLGPIVPWQSPQSGQPEVLEHRLQLKEGELFTSMLNRWASEQLLMERLRGPARSSVRRDAQEVNHRYHSWEI